MSEIKIPQITIPTIDIPDAPYFIKHKLEGKIPGCNLYHRDLETTRNPSLLISDKKQSQKGHKNYTDPHIGGGFEYGLTSPIGGNVRNKAFGL